MFHLEDIRHVHLEPTTRCNAACPMCPRNLCGTTSPGLELVELTFDDVRKVFPGEFAERLEGVDFCGAYGEPAAARDMLAIARWFRQHNAHAWLVLYTNGGIRKPEWWAELAEVIGERGRVVFGIDGIGEANGTYRRGVRFERVVANARAYIEAGGAAQWDFLVFRHNEHELEAAEATSRELGFIEFQAKKTGRFLRSAMEYVPELEGAPDTERFPIHASDGEVVGWLEPPEDRELRNRSTAVLDDLRQSPAGIEEMLDKTPISCRALSGRSIFVGAQGYVFPCCQTYTAATLPTVYGSRYAPDPQLAEEVEKAGGFEAVDARRVGLRAAVEGETLAAIAASWNKSSIAAGRLKVCARVCGEALRTFENQFASKRLIPGPQGYGSTRLPGSAEGDRLNKNHTVEPR